MTVNFDDVMQQVQFTSLVWMLIIPAVLMAVDWLTGLANAWAKHEVISSKMRTGGVKKLGELVVLGLGLLFMVGMHMPQSIERFISLYIIVMELVSIAENLADMGVELPFGIDKRLKRVAKKMTEDPAPEHPPDSGREIEHGATEDHEDKH